MSEFLFATDPTDRSDERFWSERGRPLGEYALGALGIISGQETHLIEGPDGRRLAIQLSGAPNGESAYLLHGSPGSRDHPAINPIELHQTNRQIITIDRPGYAFSDRKEGRSVVDAVADTRIAAQYLGIPPRYVIGISGGGPHALACAAELEGVEKVVAAVSLAPTSVMGDEWFDGMLSPFNVEVFEAAMYCPEKVIGMLTTAATEILQQGYGKYDPQAVRGAHHAVRSVSSHRQGLRFGPYGWIDDTLAFVRDWRFDVRKIAVPALIWSATEDIYTPLRHSERLAELIPGAKLHREASAKHAQATLTLTEMINWCLTGEYHAGAHHKSLIDHETI